MLEVKYMKISEVHPYDKNPRNNDDAVASVARSIQEFGWQQPIVVDQNMVIIVGHTRLKAALSLGLTEVPVVIADNLTPEQVQAYRITDNKTSELAEWNYELLPLEIRDLQNANMDLSLLGFDTSELEKLLSSDDVNAVLEGETDPDEIPDLPDESVSKHGEIYQLGDHILLCGDSTSQADIARLMAGSRARMLFTSPPYSDMREYNGGKDLSVGNLVNFIRCYAEYTDYQCINLGIQRKDGDVSEYWNDYLATARDSGYKLLAWNVWDKGSAGSIGQQKAMFPIRHEWIFVLGTEPFEINKTWEKLESSILKKNHRNKCRQKDGSTKYTSVGDTSNPLKAMESVITMNAELGVIRHEHPATFPVNLPLEYIKAMSSKGDVVIEPFGGSGSTLMACEQSGRICRIMELDAKYCDVIRRRWAEFRYGKGCNWQELTPVIPA